MFINFWSNVSKRGTERAGVALHLNVKLICNKCVHTSPPKLLRSHLNQTAQNFIILNNGGESRAKIVTAVIKPQLYWI